MNDKQFDNFVPKIEKLSLPALEKLLKAQYTIYLDSCARGAEQLASDKIHLCLSERKQRLNKEFGFTPENVARIRQINEQLIIATKSLLDKTKELNEQMSQILQTSDDFLHDYSIEATLTVNWENTDNLITEILDEFSIEPLRSFHFDSRNTNSPDSISGELDSFNWNEEALSAPELSEIEYFPYAAHSLFCHLYYSYSDCMAIQSFRNEINVSWGNIVKS